MPAVNFAKQFAEPVENGTKRQTIRRRRKRPIRTGDRLALYTGMRTKNCRKLREAKCKHTFGVCIRDGGVDTFRADGRWNEAWWIGSPKADDFARKDGFRNARELVEWFRDRYGLPFLGVVIEW